MNLNKFFFSLIALLVSFTANAQILGTSNLMTPVPSAFIDADVYTMAEEQAHLEGNVRVIRGRQSLSCDKALVNTKTGDFTAEGHVILISDTEYIKAEKIHYNLNTETGVIYNGYIQRGQETIEGEEIYKLGPNEFKAKWASYTSCSNCPAGWKVSGSRINATAGSYAYITSSLVRLYSVPVFWFPFMVIPIKKERQTGLLQPWFGWVGESGFAIGQSFFWDIAKNKDMTVSETYYDLRGLKTSLEYRFAADKFSTGTLNAHYLQDRMYGLDSRFANPDPRYVLIPSGPGQRPRYRSLVERYAFRYDQRFELPENFSNTMDLTWTRDRDYVLDFPNDTKALHHSELENRVNVTKNFENAHSSVDVSLYRNLLIADPIGENDSIHRAPELKYSLLARKVPGTNLMGRVDLDYMNLVRSDKAFYIPENSRYTQVGIDNGDIPNGYYRTGQRLIVRPEISYPFKLGKYFDVLPRATYDEAYYQFGYSYKPSTSRRFLRTSVQVKSSASSIFGGTDHPLSLKYKHQIEPEVGYTVVPWFYNPEHPFFGKTLFSPRIQSQQAITQFDTLQFDYRDRLFDRSLANYGITNKLIRRRYRGGVPEYREVIRHKLSQSYDIVTATEQPGPNDPGIIRQPWSEITSDLTVRLDYVTLNYLANYFPYQNVAMESQSIVFDPSPKFKFRLSHSYSFSPYIDPNYGVPVKEVSFTNHSETAGTGLFFSTKYIDLATTLDYDIGKKLFTKQSFSGILKPPGGCWGIAFTVTKTFGKEKPEYTFNLPIYYGEGQTLSLEKPPGI